MRRWQGIVSHEASDWYQLAGACEIGGNEFFGINGRFAP
jgi:hypothetical protein